MKQFFKIKRKKSPKPPRQPILPEKPANVAAGSPGLRAELDVTIPGDRGRNVSDNDPEADRTDLTVPPNEGGTIGTRVLFQDGMDGGQELHASGASTSVATIGGTGYGNQLATEGSSDAGGKASPTEPSTVAKKTHEHTLLGGAKSNTEKFGPLKVILEKIPALFADRVETVTVENRVANLVSHIAALEECFDSHPSSVAEQRRRDDLIHKLNAIAEQLRPLSEKQESSMPTDHVQVVEDVFQLLEDLREAILSHQMAQRMAIDGQGFRRIDPAEAAILNNVRCAQQAEYRHGNRSGCLRGTRAAILDKIELWTRDFDKPSVYWLNGLAGTGKSTIAQTIAERAFADGRLGASFFCSRDFEDRRSLQAIFPTLAVQLARRYTQFRSILIQLVQSDPEIIHESLYGQMKKLIAQPLAESAVSTVIVIDALDECKDKEPASAILSVLGQFVAEVPNVKFFITGRPESRIQEGFRLPLLVEATDVFVLHDVEPSQVDNDIRLFFTHSFSELKRYRRWLGDWPTKEQVGLLCERAGGLFVHAVATIRFIDHRSNSPKKQLDRLLQSQAIGAFEGKTEFKPNATLDSLYTSIFQEAFGGDDPENDSRIRSILGAVVLTMNPLSPFAIATLLGFELEEVYPILSLIHSLLVLQEDINQPVRPFHKSFPDFVADPARCTNQRFRVCPPDQHMELLVGCLETMNRELERNMCQLPDGVVNSEVIDLKERTEEYIGQALEYACRSWHKHLVGTMPAHVAPVLHEFLGKKFLFWLEVLSVLGAAREAVDALEATTTCGLPDASPTLKLARDHVRFVLAFFEVINTSAPHIYHSALLLSPRTSITREMYEQHASPLARVVQGTPVSWERVVATADFDSDLYHAVWSPCSRFIAVATYRSVEVLDAVTLSRLFIFYASCAIWAQQPGFSPDGHRLTLHDGSVLISWDLQTGGPLGAISSGLEYSQERLFSSKYSEDGKVVVAVYEFTDLSNGDEKHGSLIYTYDLLSGRRAGPRFVPEGQIIVNPIWTHDQYFRFATIDPRSIRIWQSPLTLEHPPVEVAALQVPDGTTDARRFLFLPALSRLAFVLGDTIQVLDLKTSERLLESEFVTLPILRSIDSPCGSFSSDGRFFACMKNSGEVYVWEESPAGYLLHQQLQFNPRFPFLVPQLSPNGESIGVPLNREIHRWHTRDQILSLPSVSTEDSGSRYFTMSFSPDEKFVAFTRRWGNAVTIMDLQSGEGKWHTNMDVEIDCLGMVGGTVIVVGKGSIITWNLPGGDYTFDTSINDIVRTTILNNSLPSRNCLPPSRDCSPPSRDCSPPSCDRSPLSHDHSLPSRNHFPPSRNRFPPSRNRFPPSGNCSPPSCNSSPPSRDCSPPSRDPSPLSHNHSLPTHNHSLPPRNRFPPPRNRSPPSRNRSPPSRNHSPPSRNHSPPSRNHSPLFRDQIPHYMSISPDLSCVVVAMESAQRRESGFSLEVYNVSTGSCLARFKTNDLLRPQFTQDGCEVWAGEREQFKIIEDSESGTIELKLQSTCRRQSRVFPESSRGYSVTDGGWVLSPSQKRLLWLPHRWRSGKRDREWSNGQFLAVLHGELPEMVVLEFFE